MVKKNSKKKARKMVFRDLEGDDNSNPITVPDNAPDDCPPPEIQEPMLGHISRPRHSYDLRHIFINYGGKWGRMSPIGWVDSNYEGEKSFKYGILCGKGIIYEEYVRDIAVKVNDHHRVGSYIPEGNVIELMCLYNGLPFVIRCTDDLRDMWAKGDESYPMRTQFYIKPTNIVRKIHGAEAGEYILLDEDDNDYIISPRETKKKNTTPVKATSVKAIPVKTNAKRKGKTVVMSPSKPNKAANKPAKRQKKKEKTVVLSEEEGEDLDDLPEVYHSDKEIDPEEINAYKIETQVNTVQENESECDDIIKEQERWVRYAQVGIDCLGAEDGYYNTHTSDVEDYVPTAEDLERCNEFENVDAELDDIYSKEEDDKAKTPLTVGFKELENEKQEFLNQLGIDIPGANDYLEKEPYEHWCRSYFDCTAKCEHITNNFSESFNWWIMKIRDKSLTKAFERLSLMLMKLMFERRTKAESWDQGGLVSRAVKHLEYLMTHYEEYDIEGGDKNEWVSISSTGARGRGKSEGTSSSSNAGRGRGKIMQTNNQRFADEWLSNSVHVEAPQSQERPPLAPIIIVLNTDVDGLLACSRTGETTKKKLKRVVEWVQRSRATLHSVQLQTSEANIEKLEASCSLTYIFTAEKENIEKLEGAQRKKNPRLHLDSGRIMLNEL
ncbi:hypothetical protein GIB67_017881, partial [Kingdonia uniflora]